MVVVRTVINYLAHSTLLSLLLGLGMYISRRAMRGTRVSIFHSEDPTEVPW